MTQVAYLPLMLDGMMFTLSDADSAQIEGVKRSKGKGTNLMMARKALKIMELVDDLESLLPAAAVAERSRSLKKLLPTTASVSKRGRTALESTTIGWSGEKYKPSTECLALVPFLPTVKAPPKPRASAATFDATELWRALPEVPGPWRSHGRILLTVCKMLVLYGPVLFGYLSLLYLFLGAAAMVTNPKLLVKAAFGILDAAPRYWALR